MSEQSNRHSACGGPSVGRLPSGAAGRARCPGWVKLWFLPWALASGLLALLWLALRSGAKPSRLAYPCQRAALSAAWLAFGGPAVAALAALRRRTRGGLCSPAGVALGLAGLLLTAGIWGYATLAGSSRYLGPTPDPPRGYRAQLYHVTDCPQQPQADRFPGLDTLIPFMGEDGLKFYRSDTVSGVSGPQGIVAAGDVVVIKINYQWPARGGTNTDLLCGLIRWIVDHPDGFTGEVVVCENAQFNSTSGFDRTSNNAENHAFSPHDVVAYYQGEGYPVSHTDWTLLQSNEVDEYSAGDMTDGYVVYPFDSGYNGRLSYPKFQTQFNTCVSLRDGIWDPGSSSYDRERLKFINLPVLKSHHATYGATSCIKHYMGVVTDQLSTNSHSAIGQGIMGALVGEIRPADLNILDCIWINADPYSGPSTSYDGATRRDELVASLDPVATDIWAVTNILIPAFLENGFEPPWPNPSADPEDPNSAFRRYLDRSLNYILDAGYSATNDLALIDVHSRSCSSSLPRVVTGPGPGYGNPPLVRVFPPAEGAAHEAEFEAYGPDHYGVNVAVGDVTGDGRDEILTGAGPAEIYGPHVRGFSSSGIQLAGLSFLAYGTHKWGVNVAAGDIDGDGYAEIVTGAGPGAEFGPHVRGWNVDGGAAAAIPGVSFLAYGTNRHGVRVACGDVDGDGMAEIVTAPGPSSLFGANIRGWNYDGSALTQLSGFNFFAWPAGELRYGARISSGADLDGDLRDEILVGPGPDPAAATPVKVYGYDGSQVTLSFSLDAYAAGLTRGVNAAGGNF